MIESLFGGSNEIINILGGIGFFVVVAITAWVMFVYIRAIKNNKAEGELAGENWDGIGEYKNPLPFGWAVILTVTIVWAAWYWIIGYPTNAYSQIGEWNRENNEYKSKFSTAWENPNDETLIAMGESIYLSKCAPCHGNTADGMDGRAANLTEYGHQAHIEYVIKNGSKGLGYPGGEMPAGLVSGQDSVSVSAYVAGGMKDEGAGKEVYVAACASCHGDDGKGMGGTFPDLTAYGTVEYAVTTLKNGKKGHIGLMPAFEKEGTLTEVQYQAVSKYVLSLGK